MTVQEPGVTTKEQGVTVKESGVTATELGRVSEIVRYPVATLRGERMTEAALGPEGIWGNRIWGILDPTERKVVTSARGKKPWRNLITWSATFAREPGDAEDCPAAEIHLPEGGRIATDAPDVNAQISAAIGAPAELVRRTPENRPYDLAPIHLLTTATMKALARHYPPGRFEPPRFRPNIVLDTGDAVGFVEQGWREGEMALGEARVAFLRDTERCLMTTLPQGDLPLDPAILKSISEANKRLAGIYLKVVKPGRIRIGDRLQRLD